MSLWRLEEQTAGDGQHEEMSNEVIGTTVYNQPRNSLTESSTYSEPDFATRDLPPLPVAGDTDGPDDNTDVMISNEPQIDPEFSSDVSPLIVETPYSGLESSTREPPPAPVTYDSLVKPIYVNTNAATSELTNDIICDEQPVSSGISIQMPISTSLEVETTI